MKKSLSNIEMMTIISNLPLLSNKTFPVRVSFAITKNKNKINQELKPFFEERQKLIDKYVQKDEKGNVQMDSKKKFIFKSDCKELWDKEINTLFGIKNNIEIHTIKINQLDGLNMTVDEMETLDFMIEE